MEGKVRRNLEHHYRFSWGASGRNHCSTKLSKNDLSDLINNHAMRDIVSSHRGKVTRAEIKSIVGPNVRTLIAIPRRLGRSVLEIDLVWLCVFFFFVFKKR